MATSIVALDEKRSQKTSSAGASKYTSYSTLAARVTRDFLDEYQPTSPINFEAIHDELLGRIRIEVALNNAAITGRAKHEDPRFIPWSSNLTEATIATVLHHLYRIVRIDLTDGASEPDFMLTAIYEESGPLEGTYNSSESRFRALIRALAPSVTPAQVQAIIERLGDSAPEVMRTRVPHLIPVANGVFDHHRQELRPFSPRWVFLSKLTARYNPDAQSPQIANADGTTWDFDSWMQSLSDDPEIVQLLWEVISAAVRPHEQWNRAILLAGPQGGGGKGTYVTMLQNLLGAGQYASIPLDAFSKKFATTPLLKASVNLVHENNVDAFGRDISIWKAVNTGDVIPYERKHKDPIHITWNGLDIQCHNTMSPRMKDRSASVARRLLIVPMTKRFVKTGENKAIKGDYLGRPEVLEYVLKRALEMQHTSFSEPTAVQEAVANWFKVNNRVAGFWDEVKDDFVWDLLPWKFLYDFFVAWSRKRYEAGTPVNYDSFLEEMRSLIEDSPDWEVTPRSGKHVGKLLNAPEPLISEFDLTDWMNSSYTGPDVGKRSVPYPMRIKNAYGLVRKQPRATASSATGVATEES